MWYSQNWRYHKQSKIAISIKNCAFSYNDAVFYFTYLLFILSSINNVQIIIVKCKEAINRISTESSLLLINNGPSILMNITKIIIVKIREIIIFLNKLFIILQHKQSH